MVRRSNGLGEVAAEIGDAARCGPPGCLPFRATPEEYVAKTGTVPDEAEETVFWLEIIEEGNLMAAGGVRPHVREAEELVAISPASKAAGRKDPARRPDTR